MTGDVIWGQEKGETQDGSVGSLDPANGLTGGGESL